MPHSPAPAPASRCDVPATRNDERVDQAARRRRLVVGAVLPVAPNVGAALLVSWLWSEYAGKPMPDGVAMFLGALVGTWGATAALCFGDLRALFCAWVRRRFLSDRRGR